MKGGKKQEKGGKGYQQEVISKISKLKLKKFAYESLLSVEKQFFRVSKESHRSQKHVGKHQSHNVMPAEMFQE